MLASKFDEEIYTVIFGSRLLAMSKKDGEVRPIAVGYILRRLEVKCVNSNDIEQISKILQPKQVGVVVAEEAEAAVLAM